MRCVALLLGGIGCAIPPSPAGPECYVAGVGIPAPPDHCGRPAEEEK